ncbi:MAG: hypothetical protein KAS07_06045 [Candidatus Pacebacteria bacterium]|nr:hypothetical protein [Candidatus Paceibacterota bacterium]
MPKEKRKVHDIRMSTMNKLMYFINVSSKKLKNDKMADVKRNKLLEKVILAQGVLGQDAIPPGEYASLLRTINDSIKNDTEFQKFTRGHR